VVGRRKTDNYRGSDGCCGGYKRVVGRRKTDKTGSRVASTSTSRTLGCQAIVAFQQCGVEDQGNGECGRCDHHDDCDYVTNHTALCRQ